MNNDNQQPTNPQDELAGTTNLPLDQLKKEGDPAKTAKDNPDHIADEDDLNEIRASDDLDEPDVEAYQADETDEVTNDNAPGEQTDEPANRAELDS